jgi:hypothetical protein
MPLLSVRGLSVNAMDICRYEYNICIIGLLIRCHIAVVLTYIVYIL